MSFKQFYASLQENSHEEIFKKIGADIKASVKKFQSEPIKPKLNPKYDRKKAIEEVNDISLGKKLSREEIDHIASSTDSTLNHFRKRKERLIGHLKKGTSGVYAEHVSGINRNIAHELAVKEMESGRD